MRIPRHDDLTKERAGPGLVHSPALHAIMEPTPPLNGAIALNMIRVFASFIGKHPSFLKNTIGRLIPHFEQEVSNP